MNSVATFTSGHSVDVNDRAGHRRKCVREYRRCAHRPAMTSRAVFRSVLAFRILSPDGTRMRIPPMHRCGWLLAWCLCVGSTVAAEPPSESGVGGLRFRTSRAGEVWQRELERAGFTPDAIPRLQPLLEQARDQFVNTADVNVTGGYLVERWLQQAPQEHWDRWDKSVQKAAQDAWQRWEQTRDEAAMRDFLQSYGASRLGLTGWKRFAHQAMDEGRWGHAAAALEHVRSHRAASAGDRAQAVVELIAVRVRQQRRREAAQLAATHAAELRGQTVRWGGIVRPAPEVLRDLLPPAPPEVAINSKRPVLQVDWKFPLTLPEELRTYWPEWRRDYRAEGAWLNPIAEPVIVSDHVVVQTLAGLEARPLREGQTKSWRVRHDDWRTSVETHVGRAGHQRPVQEAPVFAQIRHNHHIRQ